MARPRRDPRHDTRVRARCAAPSRPGAPPVRSGCGSAARARCRRPPPRPRRPGRVDARPHQGEHDTAYLLTAAMLVPYTETALRRQLATPSHDTHSKRHPHHPRGTGPEARRAGDPHGAQRRRPRAARADLLRSLPHGRARPGRRTRDVDRVPLRGGTGGPSATRSSASCSTYRGTGTRSAPSSPPASAGASTIARRSTPGCARSPIAAS